MEEPEQLFHACVHDCLELCQELGKEPDLLPMPIKQWVAQVETQRIWDLPR